MILKNLTTNEGLTLSHDMRWTDEHSWSPVSSAKEYSLTGTLIIDNAVRQAGRPITLQPPSAEMAWITRAIVEKLRMWAAIPGLQLQLTLDDERVFNVVFRHDEPPALEATPVTQMASYDMDSWWVVNLKMMEI